jgi:uncharacterized membrane protein YeaQ/YmgE (transglycosylase-associated protein family)
MRRTQGRPDGSWCAVFFGADGLTGFNLYSVFVAVMGAVIELLLYHLIFRRRAV